MQFDFMQTVNVVASKTVTVKPQSCREKFKEWKVKLFKKKMKCH